MADARVLPISSVKAGIKAEDGAGNGFGQGIDQAGADGTAYRQLNIVQVQKPVFNITRESRLLSGRGSVKNASDTVISQKGGTVTMPFDMIATPKLLAQHLCLVGQEHSESGSYVHETQFDGSSNATSVGSTESDNVPHSVNIAYYPAAAEGIKICGAVASDLTLSADYGTNGGFLTMGGNYFSGFSQPASTTTALEQTFDGSWVAPETSYYHIGGLTTKTLDVEGNATQNLILKSFNLNISNGVNRIGFDSNGNAEAYALPEYAITGSISLKYDDEFDYGASNNVIQDFLDGNTMSLALKWGDGTVSSAGEMNILAEIQYTGDPAQDISENGIFHNLAFECVQNSSTEALKITVFNGESQSAW
tara:strand:+ start:332 stop:1423 length:1092 start_codon:yes stop_codon:yes gene_type:complete